MREKLSRYGSYEIDSMCRSSICFEELLFTDTKIGEKAPNVFVLSTTAKLSGANPEVAMTVPKRCNLTNRPVGFKCGRMFLIFVKIVYIYDLYIYIFTRWLNFILSCFAAYTIPWRKKTGDYLMCCYVIYLYVIVSLTYKSEIMSCMISD